MIKAIVFDLGGVYFTDGTNAAIKKAGKLGIPEKQSSYIFRGKDSELYRGGKLNRRDFWKKIEKKFNIDKKTCEKLEKMWYTFIKPQKGMKQLVRELRKKYRVIIFSGITTENAKYVIKKYKIKREFDRIFFSYNYGFQKKQKPKQAATILKKLMLKTGLKPEEYLFIEDKKKLIRECKKLGINTILFKNANQLKTDLRKLGVNP